MRQVRNQGLVVAATLIIILWGIAAARPFLVPVSISGLFAFLLAPAVRALRRLGVPEWPAIGLSMILLFAPLSALIFLLYQQGQALASDLPQITASLRAMADHVVGTSLGRRLGLAQGLSPERLGDSLATRADQAIQLALTGLGALISAGTQVLLVLLLGVVMLASRVRLRITTEKIITSLVTGPEFPIAGKLLEDMIQLVEQFLVRRFLIVLIIGVVDTAILAAFGLKYTVLMGVFLGLMTWIPVIGFPIALIPPVVVSFAMGHSAVSTLALSALLLVMSAVEGNVLTPALVGRRLNINALSTFLGLLAGGLMWGLWGMLLSVPILGALRIVLGYIPSLQPIGELLSDAPFGAEKPMPEPLTGTPLPTAAKARPDSDRSQKPRAG